MITFQPKPRHTAIPDAWLRLATLLGLGLLLMQPGSQLQAATAVTQSIAKPAYLAELRAQVISAGASTANADAIVAALQRLDMSRVLDLAEARNADQLARLVPGAVEATRAPATQPGGAVQGVSGAGGSATEQAIGGLQSNLGGINDPRDRAASCYACPRGGHAGSFTGANLNDDQITRVINARNGDVITRYSDGSARIDRPNGNTEYLNSDSRLVGPDGRPLVANPDVERPSGVLTDADLEALAARLGANRTPTGETRSTTPTGGLAPTRTETQGLFTESRTSGRITVAQLQQIMRVAAEKLGPKLDR
jgi:hypothetical protein